MQYWLSVGAQPSEAVQRMLEKTGDWQQFKGLPAPPPLLVAAEKASRLAAYEAEAKAAAGRRRADRQAGQEGGQGAEAKADKAEPRPPQGRGKTDGQGRATADAETPAAPEAAEARPSDTKAVDPAEPNREAVAETQRTRPVPAPTRADGALRPALEHLVKGIVDNPDDVRVRLVDSRRGKRLEVRVHPEDLGTVIGRGGRTAKALRQVIGSIGGRGIRVDIVDAY